MKDRTTVTIARTLIMESLALKGVKSRLVVLARIAVAVDHADSKNYDSISIATMLRYGMEVPDVLGLS